jgi:hypothetical protein
MTHKDKLRAIIREEVKKELNEGLAGAVIGYLAGVLADMFVNKSSSKGEKPEPVSKVEKEFVSKLQTKYNTDPKFREIVDDLSKGTRY